MNLYSRGPNDNSLLPSLLAPHTAHMATLAIQIFRVGTESHSFPIYGAEAIPMVAVGQTHWRAALCLAQNFWQQVHYTEYGIIALWVSLCSSR